MTDPKWADPAGPFADNDTGAISAEVMREFAADVQQATASSDDTTGAGTTAVYQWTPDGSTGWGACSGNAMAPADCTALNFADHDRTGADMAGLLRLLTPGCQLWAQSSSDYDSWIKYGVAGDPTHTADFTTVPVEVLEQGPAAASAWSDVTVALLYALTAQPAGGTP